MKRVCSAIAAVIAVVPFGFGQEEFVVPQPTVPGEGAPVGVTPGTSRVAVEGIVADIFNVKKPWQLVNPVAPEEYGDGRSNGTVTYSEEDPGKPKGFIVLAIEY